jgi:hypothetical protein
MLHATLCCLASVKNQQGCGSDLAVVALCHRHPQARGSTGSKCRSRAWTAMRSSAWCRVSTRGSARWTSAAWPRCTTRQSCWRYVVPAPPPSTPPTRPPNSHAQQHRERRPVGCGPLTQARRVRARGRQAGRGTGRPQAALPSALALTRAQPVLTACLPVSLLRVQVPQLPAALEQYLSHVLQARNCCAVLEVCLRAGAGALADICTDFIRLR